MRYNLVTDGLTDGRTDGVFLRVKRNPYKATNLGFPYLPSTCTVKRTLEIHSYYSRKKKVEYIPCLPNVRLSSWILFAETALEQNMQGCY